MSSVTIALGLKFHPKLGGREYSVRDGFPLYRRLKLFNYYSNLIGPVLIWVYRLTKTVRGGSNPFLKKETETQLLAFSLSIVY
jgi:hypothetical protein